VGGKTSGASADGVHWHDVHQVQVVKTSTVMVFVPLLHPRSRGHVRLRSHLPLDAPIIEHELLGVPADIQDLATACGLAREIMNSTALAPYVMEEELPGQDVDTSSSWETYLRTNSFGAFHQSGTCRMGPDSDAVLDPALRVRGISGLRVVDASIMPTVTSGNTNAPTIMIAEKASDLILGEWGD
jgi:choline dehydrogenase